MVVVEEMIAEALEDVGKIKEDYGNKLQQAVAQLRW